MSRIRAFTMPKWGIEMTEGTIAEWMVKEGESFTRGQTLCLIETAKITNEVEAEYDATVRRIMVAGGGEAVTEIRQVAVDAEFPGVAERLDLLRLARQVLGLRVLHVPLAGAHLPVAAELDAVGRVEVDALHAPAEPLLLSQTGHHHQAVAQD